MRGAQNSFALATLALGSPATRAPGCAQNSGGGLRTELALPPALASLAWARGSRFAPGFRRSGARVPASRGLRRPPARPFGCRAPSRLRRLPLHTVPSGLRRLGLPPSRPCPVPRAPCGRRGGSLRSPAAIHSGSSGGLRAFARPRRPRLAHGPLAVARLWLAFICLAAAGSRPAGFGASLRFRVLLAGPRPLRRVLGGPRPSRPSPRCGALGGWPLRAQISPSPLRPPPLRGRGFGESGSGLRPLPFSSAPPAPAAARRALRRRGAGSAGALSYSPRSPRFGASLRCAPSAVAPLRDLRTRRFAPDAQNASLRFPPPPAHGSRLPARRPSFVSLTACHSVRALPSRRVDPHAVRHSLHDGHARGAHSLAALITLAAAGSLFSSVACGDLTHPPPMWALSFFGGAGTRTTPVPPHVPPFIMCACAGFPQIRRRGR